MVTILLTAINARNFVAEINIKKLEEENQTLVVKLNQISNSLTEQDELFVSYIDQDVRARTYWQMPGIHPEIWSMGIGGKKIDSSPRYLSSGTESILSEIYNSVEILNNKCMMKLVSCDDIQQKIDEKYTLWQHIPSINPVPGYSIGSGFGYRVDPLDKRSIKMHWGVDIGTPRGVSILATADGVVSYTGWNLGYGLEVDIDHGYGFKTRYAHCHTIYVNTGDFVKRGQVIASVGSTGRTTCTHLHYEIHVSGVKVNPRNYIDQNSFLFE